MTDKRFIDSNIWLYSFIKSDAVKHEKAKELVKRGGIYCSVQVVNEVCFNLKRKAGFDELKIEKLINSFFRRCSFVQFGKDLLIRGSKLRQTYSLSFWDSLIVSAALMGNCEVLYSEDMQHELLIEKKLRIINPLI